jgi:hypothetical protein
LVNLIEGWNGLEYEEVMWGLGNVINEGLIDCWVKVFFFVGLSIVEVKGWVS